MINLMNCGNLIFFLSLGCSGHVTVFWPIREILLVGVGVTVWERLFSFIKMGAALPSLPAWTVTSEDVLSGAVAAPDRTCICPEANMHMMIAGTKRTWVPSDMIVCAELTLGLLNI